VLLCCCSFRRPHRFKSDYNISLYKTSGVDPLRADQASEEVALAFQTKIQETLTAIHAAEPELFPWATLAEVPDEFLHNMDEMGEKGKHKRSKKLCSGVEFPSAWMQVVDGLRSKTPPALKRLWENTAGDHDDGLKHRTVALTTCGNGKFASKPGEPGACPPVIIHDKPLKAGEKKTTAKPSIVTPTMKAGIVDDRGVAKHGIKVRFLPLHKRRQHIKITFPPPDPLRSWQRPVGA